MKLKTEELLIITLTVVIFVAIFITIEPSVTGFVTYEFLDFTYNENFIINETIQLKQHSYTENTIQEIYYFLTFAEENGKTKLVEISQKDDKFVELDTQDMFKIKFNNTLEDGDKLNTYLARPDQRTFYVCDFNAINSCENETIYASFNYPGIEGHYQLTLTLPEPTNEFAIYSADGKLKFDYINASHIETTENIIYYYNSDSVETEIIQPENLDKWDIFTADYILNNQTISFHYSIGEGYTEFTPSHNFSSINSSSLKFKLDLLSDNISTPIIYNLSINYIETIENNESEQNETTEEPEQNDQEISSPSSSGSAPSLTRYKSSLTTTTATPAQTKSENTKTVSVPIKVETAPEPEQKITEENFEKTPNKLRITMNVIALGYIVFICLLLYRRRHNL